MKLFDLHCDTLYEIYKKKESFEHNDCHISLDKAEGLEEYIQVTAIWSEHRLSCREAYEQYRAVIDYSKKHNLSIINEKKCTLICAFFSYKKHKV